MWSGLALLERIFRSCFSIGWWYVGIVYPISHRVYPNSSGQKRELKLHFCHRQMHLSSTATPTTGKNYQKDLPKSVCCTACYHCFTAKKPLINFLSVKETNVLWARKSNGMSHIVWESSQMSHFRPIIVLLKLICLVMLFVRKLLQCWMRLFRWFSNTVCLLMLTIM